MTPKELTLTVADLLALLDRHKKALCEGGRPDLAERASISIRESAISISYHRPETRGGVSPEVARALEIDPEFEAVLG